MQNLVNKEEDRWIRPWNKTKFDDIDIRDERFFALVIKGALSWLNNNLVMYDNPIRHFIFQTGSTYMYVENNGYEYSTCEVTGEDWMTMSTPRCLCTVGSFSIPTEELTSPHTRGTFERMSGDEIVGYNAEFRRMPIEISMTLRYVFSTFNEGLVFVQELFEKTCFQQYFRIAYLGQQVDCSIEMDENTQIQFENPDLAGTNVNQRTMEFDIKICTNLPIFNEKTAVKNSAVISSFKHIVQVKDERPEIERTID